jgi:hypothetical protein
MPTPMDRRFVKARLLAQLPGEDCKAPEGLTTEYVDAEGHPDGYRGE